MNDPIVNEVRKLREILLGKHGGNLREYIKFLRREEEKNPERLIKKTVVNIQKKIHLS
ncbi:MAG: hypothetical protein A4E52_01001 [Pelotomaculum sp. PtaB.Bin013]|uniref:Uncharacterized protein n=1 Tax=Pelotomaculum isophthalicicum JI TaxID=947010 RepID=A0A9X4GYW3_9FIRM|nr:hypothetical protein [Pelotomaculum isophthalicicum]MDF9408167.1 hypothetical protein [Pelotomaculum isophthalicicum JI]OPX89527.1 MAG: hypothetical protein A4E52_01001 [Pelotomaculum sp. PtaB.Bin013]